MEPDFISIRVAGFSCWLAKRIRTILLYPCFSNRSAILKQYRSALIKFIKFYLGRIWRKLGLAISKQYRSALITIRKFNLGRTWRKLGTVVKWDIATKQLLYVWNPIRSLLIVPTLRLATVPCVSITVMILLEKLFFGTVCLAVKIFGLKPEKRYKWEPIKQDEELGTSVYPMVLVQIPMYNEKEVYKLSIGAACALEWPSDRLIIQVLDDSTDIICKVMVGFECQRWKNKGINIMHEVRNHRKGYKAGALQEGLQHDFVKACEYIAIFDADFQPESDFLLRTVPFLMHNPDIALVQARWKFVNADECLMTRLQEMSLDYHFKIEQEAGSSVFAFFGFNGTAGVWRTKTISDVGGWKDRTTVGDMDLAVRAGLRGWKFVYVGDIEVKSELPSTFKAYRFQQHRWSCGPANLFKKMAIQIVKNEKVSFWKKVHLIYDFFFLGKFVAHIITFIYYCVVIPLVVLFPEVTIPYWGVVSVPILITICKCISTPSSFRFVVVWLLFENVMSLHRLKAACTGLFEAERVNEWIVTEKLGDANKTKPVVIVIKENNSVESQLKEPCIPILEKKKSYFWDRLYHSELIVGVFLLFCGYYDIAVSKKGYFIYLIAQSAAFFVVGFGYVGIPTPKS